MRIAVVDIETTGFGPKSSIVEVGIVLLDLETGKIDVVYDELVKEDGLSEDDRKAWIFSNSTLRFEDVMRAKPLDVAVIQNILSLYHATAYNKSFDFNFFKTKNLVVSELDCPMQLARNICKIPNKRGGYKPPTVEEAWKHFFPRTPYVELHRGADDAVHEAQIVYALYKAGVFKVPRLERRAPGQQIIRNEGETMEPTFDFGQAIAAMKSGQKVARGGWNGKGMWLALQVPDEHSKMRQPYIYMSPVGGELVPWLASQSDMLAEDWFVVQ